MILFRYDIHYHRKPNSFNAKIYNHIGNKPMTDAEIHTLFYAAIESSQGIVVSTSSSEQLKKRCYVARAAARKQNILDFDSLTFQISPDNPHGELWIMQTKPMELPNA